MASNPTPEDDSVLLALTEDLADGCHLHEAAIGIKQNTEATMRAALAAATGADAALGTAEKDLENAETALKAADAAGKVILSNCRLRLVKVLGPEFNAGWAEAGFPDGKTAVPRDDDQRFPLLGKLQAYFTAHPEAASVDMEATAAICGAGHAAISDARAAANEAGANATNAEKTREAAYRTLRKRVRGLIEELGTLLSPEDARYEAFGLNIPANPSVPEPIETLNVVALGGGRLLVEWSYATRMTAVRVMRKLPGPDEEFASQGTAVGLNKVLLDQPVGVTVEIFAVPYNDGGDGPQSPTKSVTVT